MKKSNAAFVSVLVSFLVEVLITTLLLYLILRVALPVDSMESQGVFKWLFGGFLFRLAVSFKFKFTVS